MADTPHTCEHPWTTRQRVSTTLSKPHVQLERGDDTLRRYRDTARELLALLQREEALYARLKELNATCELTLHTTERTDTLISYTWPKHLLQRDLATIDAHLNQKRKGRPW